MCDCFHFKRGKKKLSKDIDGLLLMHAGNVVVMQEHVIHLGRGSGLRARVTTGPEPDAHRREEQWHWCHGQDARLWVA